jgi:DNA-binding NarL/FixJ family response regulator
MNRCIVGGTTIDVTCWGQGNVISTEIAGHHAALDRRKTILIADDSRMVRSLIRQALERETDFEVCGEAIDGTEAVSKAKELSPDLIILDVRMPGLNGLEVAGILRYALPRIRIVLVTMYAEDVGNTFASVFRIDAVLAKARGLTELATHVTSLLNERQLNIEIPPDREAHFAAQRRLNEPSQYWKF